MIIGIDLGTTKSVVGFMKAGEAVIIPDAQGRTSIPSLVLVTPSEEIFVGHAARKHPDFFHGKSITISSVKRMMGKKGETGWGWWKTYPQEVSAFILAELKNQAEMYLGEEVEYAVIAIPSHFDESQRRAVKEAALIAGLISERLLNEATAAVLAYGVSNQRDERVLVFDFGGGTLDVAILDIGQGVFEVKCIEGDSKLGGDDFDEIIFNYVMEQCRQQHGVSLELSAAQEVFLREAARHAKVELSQALNTTVSFPGFFKIGNRHVDLQVFLDRSTFERLSQPLFDQAAYVLRKAVRDPAVEGMLDKVLLLGGTSRIPYIYQMVKEELGIAPFRGVDPELAVAQGAILQAGVWGGYIKDILLLDVTPRTYGIEMQDGVFEKIIEKNTTVPTRKSIITTTTQDNQRSVAIRVFQGEAAKALDNLLLETIVLEGIPVAPKGLPQIEVTFDIDPNIILHVSARDLGTGKKQSARLQSPYGLNPAQVKLMSRKIAAWLAHRRWEGLKDFVLQITQAATELLTRFPQALTGELIENLQNERTRLLTYMHNEDESENPSAAIFRFEKIYQEANFLVERYEKKINEIDNLRRKIDSFVKDFPQEIASIGFLLIQGKELLLDFKNRRVPYEELQKLYLFVRAEYENARVSYLYDYLVQFLESDEVSQWEQDIPHAITQNQLREQHLARLEEIHHVKEILSQLRKEHPDYLGAIWKKLFHRFKKTPKALAYFITLTSAFAGFSYSEVEKEFVHTRGKGNQPVLDFGLFAAGLHHDKPESHRLAAAKLIRQLPTYAYLPAVVDSCRFERNLEVIETLWSYVDSHPAGTFYEFFLQASPDMKEKICSDKWLLRKLLKEPQEDGVLCALEHLVRFPPREVLPYLLPLLEFPSRQLRARALEHLISILSESKDENLTQKALASLEKKRVIEDKDYCKLLRLIAKIVSKRRSINFIDKLSLNKMRKRSPYLGEAICRLYQFRKSVSTQGTSK